MIKCNKLPTHLRTSVTSELFGLNFPMKLEPLIFNLTDHIADNYSGVYWDFYTLSNGGFYMSPCSDEHFNVNCENGFDEACAEHYYLLREVALDHDEARGIFSAID